MLTRKQYQLLVFINQCLKDNGVPPSFDEMKEALALKSKSGVHRLITGLEERGFIRRLPHKARALEVLRLPENAPQEGRPNVGKFAPRIISNNAAPLLGTATEVVGDAGPHPRYGRHAHGTPIEAQRDDQSQDDVPASQQRHGDHDALEFEGFCFDEGAPGEVLQADVQRNQRQVVANREVLDVALVLEHHGYGYLELATRHAHFRIAHPQGIAHAAQHVGDRIGHNFTSLLW